MTAARNLASALRTACNAFLTFNLDHLLELFQLRRDAAGLQPVNVPLRLRRAVPERQVNLYAGAKIVEAIAQQVLQRLVIAAEKKR